MWSDVGEKEGRRAVHNVDALDRRLRANHWRPGETLQVEKVPGGTQRRRLGAACEADAEVPLPGEVEARGKTPFPVLALTVYSA